MNRVCIDSRCRCAVWALAVLLALVRSVAATTIVAKDLDALCAEADRVFVGTVSQVRAQWADTEQRHIETLVTFAEIEPLFGVDTTEVILRFSGGQVGDLVEHVGGVPTFTAGERAVIFARDGRSVSPLVGFHQGCVRVQGDGDDATVSTPSYETIGTGAGGQRLLADTPRAGATVLLRDFITDVRQRLASREGGK